MQSPVDRREIREALKGVSRRLYGRQFRLEVAAAIDELPPPVWSRKVARALDIPENQVAREFRDFAALGAIQAFPLEHDRRKTYSVVDHPLWDSSRALFERTIHELRPADADAADEYRRFLRRRAEPEPIREEGG
jgi:hypothetical protein